ncbi:MAG: hypothetical protein KKD44_26380, partial [Proteobacteria bacterium]|nr:hypothetical protein [Pseudomonadota bacterium]
MPEARFLDADGRTHLRVTGANASGNASGVSYQYVVICDPGGAFIHNGAVAHGTNIASALQALRDLAFTPEAGFFLVEQVSTGVTARHWYKGPGHANANASLLGAAETADVVSWGPGGLTTQTPLHISGAAQIAYSLWRRYVPGSSCSRALYFGSYTGDGAGGVRDLALELGTLFPLFAMVTPHNAKSWVRDPSHAGADSSDALLTSISTTAIVGGGSDLLQVGTTLNAAGI